MGSTSSIAGRLLTHCIRPALNMQSTFERGCFFYHKTSQIQIHKTFADRSIKDLKIHKTSFSRNTALNRSSALVFQESSALFTKRQLFTRPHAVSHYGNAKWRTVRDSNPRRHCCLTRFPSVRIRPLCHLSVGILWDAGGTLATICLDSKLFFSMI